MLVYRAKFDWPIFQPNLNLELTPPSVAPSAGVISGSFVAPLVPGPVAGAATSIPFKSKVADSKWCLCSSIIFLKSLKDKAPSSLFSKPAVLNISLTTW